MEELPEFADRVVLVTGAGGCLGRRLALGFAVRGARLAVNDLSPVNLDETVAAIQVIGGQVKDYIFDVAKKMPVQIMVDQIITDWGRIDVLVNAAEVVPSDSLMEMDEWDWHRTLDVDLSGPFLMTQVVGAAMRPLGGGVIINIAVDMRQPDLWSGRAAYLASKAGLIGLTQAATGELEAHNIRIHAVCPHIFIGEGELQEVIQAVLGLCSPGAPAGQILYPG